MKPLVRFFDRLWFAPMTPVTLAVCRWITGGFSLFLLLDLRTYFVRAAAGRPEVFRPIGVVSFMEKPMSSSNYDTLIGICIFLAGLFTVGIWHRVLAPIFAALFLFVLTYSNSWAMVYHTENMLILHVILLAITPSASALSMDASYTRDKPELVRFGLAPYETEAHFRFRWPVRLLQVGATLPYVVAGVAKIAGKSGISWANGENLRDQVTMNGLYYEVLMGGAEPITFQVYGWDKAFFAAASLTLVVELGAPLALLHRYLGYLFVVSIMAMHWSILWIMGIPFRYQLWGCAFACFFEWDSIIGWITSRWRHFVTKSAASTNTS
jgi:hypothetical protein